MARRVSFAVALLATLSGCGGGDPGAPINNDVVAPTVALTAPANLAAALTGNVTVSASASDNVGVTAVEFRIDGIALANVTAAPFQATVSTADHAAGQHVLRARARDAAGNLSPWASATVHFGGGQAVQAAFTKTDAWVGGLTNATAIAQAGDGRFFVAEQGGTLRVVKNSALLATPFKSFVVDASGERGLLGVALHPNFAVNGWVYVYHTTTAGGTHNRITRLTASGDVSDGFETAIVDMPTLSSATNHNGGALHFGADGNLYVGVGENANGAHAQNLDTPFGKMLRLNDDGSFPSDNPVFTTAAAWRSAVWAYGLRNPFTFAVQPGTGRIHINDVGAGTWEEIDLGASGANYGWPASEGPDGLAAGMTAPLFAYKHSAASPPGSGPGGFFTGFAIAGGAFYPSGGSFPAAYHGSYFFADFVGGYVGRLDLANDNAASMFAGLTGAPVDMVVGNDGALYVLLRGAITRIAAR